MHIRHVQLDEWDVDTQKSISNSHACVGESARVDDDHIDIATGLVNAVNDCTLPIGLECVKLNPQTGALCASGLDDIVQSRAAIKMRLPCPEKVQIRPIDQKDTATHRLVVCRRSLGMSSREM